MYRGTTPTNVFRTDVDLSNASVLFITYKQGGKLVLELSQKDTLLFSEGIVTIQIRAKFPDGSTIASSLIRTSTYEILKDGEI